MPQHTESTAIAPAAAPTRRHEADVRALPVRRAGNTRESTWSAILLLDDDLYADLVARALSSRGLSVDRAGGIAAVLDILLQRGGAGPDYAVVDLERQALPRLAVIGRLVEVYPGCRVVALCDPKQLSDAVLEKLAPLDQVQVLAKPLTSAVLASVLLRPESRPTSALGRKIDSATLLQMLAVHGWNVSATARSLKMSRRSLQRRLALEPKVFVRPD
jgi:two-component system response regulator RegA